MWSVPCSCHALNLVLTSWASLDNIKQYLDIGKCIVQFVKNSTRMHAFYQAQHPKQQLIRPVTTRFETYYYMLRRLWEEHGALQSQPATTTETANQAMTAVEDFNFWVGVEKTAVMHKNCLRKARMEIHLGMFGPLRLHLERAEKVIHIYQNHQIWDRKESETSCSSATWTRGEFDIPKENDSPVVGGNGTGHTTIGFRSYAKVDADDSMFEDEDDDFDRDSNLRLANGSEISGLGDDMG
ncbi:hypothetical protein SELMODRAFT_420981 [Selaginella moellendorffii]|uniref:DUF659 domain-containing protein n=1 Tax=Selaginella moellendorffii TaxID=88036 RepID=D8SDR5_SELML|nr:hypothetical protein SELMODRAFT_420981 [Selaginella moellendorffii]